MNEDLRDWFGKGKKGGAEGGGWDRYNTKGERIGKCAREPGEPKPKCLSKEKASKMGKEKIAAAVRRKRDKDPVADREGKGGKPKMVSNKITKSTKQDQKMEEAYERFQRLGKNYKVFFTFRGQYKSLDFFFPTAKRPSRQDVKTQLNKIFPESVLINYFEREREEDKPVVHVEGAKSFGNFIAEVSAETKSDIKRRFADRKSNKEFRAGGGYAAMDQKGQTADEVRTQGQRNFEPRKFQAPNVHNTKTKGKITYGGNPPMTFKIGEDKSDVEEGLVTGALAGAALVGGVASIMSRAKKATSKENHSDKAVGKPTLQGVASGFRNRNAALEKARKKARGESFDPEGETIEEKSAAWTRKSGKNKEGGLNEKGRKSYEAENPGSDLKAPSKKKGNKRRASFCARMKGMKSKLTSAKTARDPDSRINKSLRAWNC